MILESIKATLHISCATLEGVWVGASKSAQYSEYRKCNFRFFSWLKYVGGNP